MIQTGCQCDPALKVEWGCDEPAQQAVWTDLDGDVYYTCPVRFITEHVLAWFQEYSYCKEFNTSPGEYSQIPSKWIEALDVYRKALGEYEEANKPRGPDKLGALKAGVRGRK